MFFLTETRKRCNES